ncbi:MAG: WbqC family protein [Bacteroidales bacterium]
MSLPLLSTAYLPSIEYIAIMLRYGGAVIEIHETFPKQTYRNRCHIATSAGLLAMVIPVYKPNGNHTSTKEICISYHLPWNRSHWRSIEAAYNSSPFFLYYRDAFEPLYKQHFDKLAKMNIAFLETILNLLKIDVSLTFSDSYCSSVPHLTDLRLEVHPKKPPFLLKLSDFPKYTQVFENENGFLPNLSIIDLLFNIGPDAKYYLERMGKAIDR